MPDITIPAEVAVAGPVKASDHNGMRTAVSEIIGSLNSIENSQLINGSFETDLSSWVASNVGGGSNVIEESVVVHGAKSFKATATAGGGYVDLDSDDFLNVSAEIDDVFIDGRIRVTAQLKVQAWIEWFDSADVSISTRKFMDYTFGASELNEWLRFRGWGRAVPTARSYKLTFQLGDGTLAGSVYLDGITSRLNTPYPWIMVDPAVPVGSVSAGVTQSDVVPVIGLAYAAYTYFTDDTDVAAEFTYDLETASWINTNRDNSRTSARQPISVDGFKCDDSGQLRVQAGAGSIDYSYNMWR